MRVFLACRVAVRSITSTSISSLKVSKMIKTLFEERGGGGEGKGWHGAGWSLVVKLGAHQGKVYLSVLQHGGSLLGIAGRTGLGVGS